MAKALVLEKVRELSLRDIDLPMEVGPDDVKIKIDTVGVCGSDVHYYTHGRIGGFVVNAPMVLGHEAAGVIVADLVDEKRAIAGRYPGVTPVNVKREKLADAVAAATDGWGADVVFEASGSPRAWDGIQALICPGGCVVAIGMPVEPVKIDISTFAAKEIRVETVFRYANVFDRALQMIASGKVDLKPLISATVPFE